MAGNAIDRFLEAIGYPERASAGEVMFTLQVDGDEIVVSVAGDMMRLTLRLTNDDEELPRLAGYAAGRMLREEATLACDKNGVFLWQQIPANSNAYSMQRFFETFCDSCDWWRARLKSDNDRSDAGASLNEMRILP